MNCYKCKEDKPLAAFTPARKKKRGVQGWCRECQKAYDRQWYVAHRESRTELNMERQRRRIYGVPLGTYQQMVTQQHGACAICGHVPSTSEKKLSIDHDHVTGLVRGLLCSRCNMTLGHLGDSVELLERMIVYLKNSHVQNLLSQ